ncbi:DUF3597 domain-containing protein [Ramlibacter ginsenosidimutans]|uniref:DUF3597 domain-containing protein n=1 Tax=Ramlibacter ginsenosidimutans TaxID=502333 RepID=A0A934TX12_9BURK|nr:DUF3597 domain-containing protein [Ramlibacter ginsenosidimutans]MBK6009009.1 DUF3597 domain-containing protein [Ramlibacter ginsenosidimutans]
MSILGTIFSRLLPHASASQAPAASPAAASPAAAQPARPAAPTQAATAQPASAQSAQTQPAAPQPQAQGMQPQQAAAGAGTATMERVDIEQVLDGLAARNPNKLNWRTSIVDLMKLVGMDSTLQERKELADELGYRGDKNDSAAMNIWLHKEVMVKLEENGGKVPENLKH